MNRKKSFPLPAPTAVKVMMTLMMMMMTMTACHNGHEEEQPEPDVPFSFTLNPIGLDGLFPMTEPGTRGATDATLKPSNLLILDVVDGNVVERNTVELAGSTEEVLQPQTLNLAYGSHTLYFLFSSSQYDEVDKEDLTVSWETRKLNYVWAKKQEVTVTPNTAPGSYNLTLDIVVAQIKLRCDGDIYPANIGNIKAVSAGLCWTLDLETMDGQPASTDKPVEIVLDLSSYAGKTGQPLTIYTFVPPVDEEEGESPSATTPQSKIGQIVYTAYTNASAPAEIISHTLTDVPVQKGFITQYSGSFFGGNTPFTYFLEDKWENTIEMTY